MATTRQRPTATGLTDAIHSDFKTGFSVHPVKGDLLVNTNEDAIKRSIRNILLTDYYERPKQPTFGGNIRAMLFENFSASTIVTMKRMVELAITNYEPRAQVLDVIVSGDPDNNYITIKVVFSTSSRTEADTVDVILERVR
jgi:phage baseplate assembly protein W